MEDERTDGQRADLERSVALQEPTLTQEEVQRYVDSIIREKRMRKMRARAGKRTAQIAQSQFELATF